MNICLLNYFTNEHAGQLLVGPNALWLTQPKFWVGHGRPGPRCSAPVILQDDFATHWRTGGSRCWLFQKSVRVCCQSSVQFSSQSSMSYDRVCTCTDVDLVSSMSSRLDMKAGDLVELIQSDVTPRPSTSRDTESRDINLLYGRNEATGRRGSFTASCVYILPTVDKPTSDFVVSNKPSSQILVESATRTFTTFPCTARHW